MKLKVNKDWHQMRNLIKRRNNTSFAQPVNQEQKRGNDIKTNRMVAIAASCSDK